MFGKNYNELFDGKIIYDVDDKKFYCDNLNGTKFSLWLKFYNHR